jgi:ubiquinone/menaquinone biosynthesis C-methylase UbiE
MATEGLKVMDPCAIATRTGLSEMDPGRCGGRGAARGLARLLLFLVFCASGASHAGAQEAAPPAAEMSPSHQMHHHMEGVDGAFHHRFEGAENWAKEFDSAERDDWQKPQEVLEALKIGKSATVADIGAGTGYFAMRIARLAPQGRVYAVDVEPDMTRYLAERAKREGLTNVIPVQAQADNAALPEPVDLALVVDTFHHIGHRVAYFTQLKSSLKDGGRLVIIDFKADSPSGPPPQYRIPLEQAADELIAAGYTLVEAPSFLPRQYMLIFRKGAP